MKCFRAARHDGAVIALIFGFLGAGLASADPAAAGPACPGLGYAGDEHRFRLFRNESPVGDETFQIEEDADSIGALSLRAEGNVDLAGSAFSFVQKLTVDPLTYAFRSYDLGVHERSGATQSIRAVQTADSVVLSIDAKGGAFRRSFPSGGEAMVLDNLIVNHLALIACRIERDGFRPETLSVLVPQVGAVFPAIVAPQPTGRDGTRRIEIRIATVTETLSIDAAGRLARIEIPSQSLHYVRMLPAFDVPPQGGAQEGTPQQGAPPQRPPQQSAPREGGAPQGVPPTAAPYSRPYSPRTEIPRIPDSGPPTGRALFTEETVQFLSKGTAFDAILTLPSAGQKIPYPSVLLIPGSGPRDRDDTLGPNRPFRDLARGLAVMGIASLRYDNRALAFPSTIDPRTATIRDSVIDDAIGALEFLRTRTEIDGSRLAIVGHGAGTETAAFVPRGDGPVAGLVLIRADPRPLDADLSGAFRAFGGPILILQPGKAAGAREDLDMWRATAERIGKRDMTIQGFPDLGEGLIPIKGDPTPASLAMPGNVDPSLIETIGTFVQSVPRKEGRR